VYHMIMGIKFIGKGGKGGRKYSGQNSRGLLSTVRSSPDHPEIMFFSKTVNTITNEI